ncbi:STAS/SEC14 domain-containing protein [Bacteroidota bacterium]
MITYSLKTDIFLVIFEGKITFEEIVNYLKDFSDLEDLPNDLLLLYDLSNVELNFAPAEIKMISHVADLSTQKYSSIKTAFLVDKPKMTAYSTLFSNLADEIKTQRKIFSTKEAALEWLNSKK